MERKKSIGVTIFGCIFIIQASLLILYLFINYIKLNNELKNVLSIATLIIPNVSKYFSCGNIFVLFIYLIALLFCLIYLICGIGILRIKPWARYIVITLLLTYILSIPNKGLFFGWQSLSIQEVLIKIAVAFFILYFFMKPTTIKQFEPERVKFQLKSSYGITICLVILLTLLFPSSLLISKVYYSLRYKKPFFNIRPQIIKLGEIDDQNFLESARRIELFDTSVLIPKDFAILNFGKLSDENYSCILKPTKVDQGFISLSNLSNIYEGMEKTFKFMRFKDVYDFERAIYTNNWSPILIVLRNIGTPEGKNFKIEEIDSPGVKGFIRSRHNEKERKWMYICSLYSKDNRVYREMLIVLNEKEFSKSDISNIISSLSFLKKQKVDSHKYYQQGLKAFDSGDYITAQFKFANAYYLFSKNPEYGYMLARMLFKNGKRSFQNAKNILMDMLELKPDYEEAKKLLETINNLESSSSSPAPR